GDTGAAVIGLGALPIGLIGELMLWTAAGLTLLTGWDYWVAGVRHAAPGGKPAADEARGQP
nr:CDP-diacylglycerol--glycerol-3-phosphate 3-phosphatidyltransferase [Rubritepida sp.]